MRTTRGISRTFLALAALMALLAFGVPHQAWALSVNTTDNCGPNGPMANANQALATTFAQTGQAKIMAGNAIADLYGRVNAIGSACMQNLMKIFSSVGALSDPLNLLYKFVAQQIIADATKVCQTVLSDVNQIKQYLMSQLNQFCIPIPNLGLGLNGIHLTASTPCTGIPLMSAMQMPAGSALPSYGWRGFFPYVTVQPFGP